MLKILDRFLLVELIGQKMNTFVFTGGFGISILLLVRNNVEAL